MKSFKKSYGNKDMIGNQGKVTFNLDVKVKLQDYQMKKK